MLIILPRSSPFSNFPHLLRAIHKDMLVWWGASPGSQNGHVNAS